MPKKALVAVEQLSIQLGGQTIIPSLSFDVRHNEILGIVGESGSGKSITAMSLMGLLPKQEEILQASRLDFDGQSLIPFDEKRFRALRGKEIGMVFQDIALFPHLSILENIRFVTPTATGILVKCLSILLACFRF